MNKKLIIIIVVAIIAIGMVFTLTGTKLNVSAGPTTQTTINSQLYVTGQFSEGGAQSISATLGTSTLTLSPLDIQNSVVLITSGTSTVTTTVTTPATSTLTAWMPNIGDTTGIYVVNASSTMGTITIAAGAGSTLLSASSTSVIQPAKYGMLRFIRNTANTFLIGMTVAN